MECCCFTRATTSPGRIQEFWKGRHAYACIGILGSSPDYLFIHFYVFKLNYLLLYFICYTIFSICYFLYLFIFYLLINSMVHVLKKQYNYSAELGKNTPVFSRMYLFKYFKYQGQIQINTNLYSHFQQFQIQITYLNPNTIRYLTPTLVTTFRSIFGSLMITD